MSGLLLTEYRIKGAGRNGRNLIVDRGSDAANYAKEGYEVDIRTYWSYPGNHNHPAGPWTVWKDGKKENEMTESPQNGKEMIVESVKVNGLGEAPASLTIKCSIQDFEVLFTMRDYSGRALLEKVEPALSLLTKLGAQPVIRYGSNGNASNNEKEEAHVCPIHSVPLKKFEKDGRTWWSHKAVDADGVEFWCRGKEKTNGG